MKSAELRKSFLEYFEAKEHKVVSSSPLIPIGDNSLLFTTAGMVQFKGMFAGEVELNYKRAVSCQKCLRTTDLENTGRTPRHHSFFEMLGNFSFGDYFKKEAIRFAWDYSIQVLGLESERIGVSVYLEDDEAHRLWKNDIGVPESRIVRLGKKDNFWGPPGDSGACGPCTELYYDLGESFLTQEKEEDSSIGGENNRHIEYWNLVFNEFYQTKEGKMIPLSQTGIDTGMGLERLTMVAGGLASVYETDLFVPILNQIQKLTSVSYNQENQPAFHVIADHIRAVSFLLAENIFPSNEGRGYVIRRLIRRAGRFAHSIGKKEAFLFQLVPVVAQIFDEVYPEIQKSQDHLARVLKLEEESFLKTLQEGSEYLESLLQEYQEKGLKTLSGRDLFRLYDSMGFPVDMVEEICLEKGMKLDRREFDHLMEQQKERARQNWKGDKKRDLQGTLLESLKKKKIQTEYTEEKEIGSTICYLLKKDIQVELPKNQITETTKKEKKEESYSLYSEVSEGDEIILISKKSPFYGEAGGQIGDIGQILNGMNSLEIWDTQRLEEIILHYGRVSLGVFKVDDPIQLKVHWDRKMNIGRNHSATHLLHHCLQKVLGSHARQMGSLVAVDRLRFDFSHFEPLTYSQIVEIEREVNGMILENIRAEVQVMETEEALKQGAQAFFLEKYGRFVRTLKMAGSFELCGGTHMPRTGDIGFFKILSENSIAKGTRRIEAVTGKKALEHSQNLVSITKNLEKTLNSNVEELENRVSHLLERNKTLEKELQEIREKGMSFDLDSLIGKSLKKFGEAEYLSLYLENRSPEELRAINDRAKQNCSKLLSVLVSEKGDKLFYLVWVSKEWSKQIEAKELVNDLSQILGGKGGGRDQMAQGSSPKNSPQKVKKALEEIQKKLQTLLNLSS